MVPRTLGQAGPRRRPAAHGATGGFVALSVTAAPATAWGASARSAEVAPRQAPAVGEAARVFGLSDRDSGAHALQCVEKTKRERRGLLGLEGLSSLLHFMNLLPGEDGCGTEFLTVQRFSRLQVSAPPS